MYFAELILEKRTPLMENYIVSARKYRPATFESVVGQHALTITLKMLLPPASWHMPTCSADRVEWENNVCTYLCQDHQLPDPHCRRRSLQSV